MKTPTKCPICGGKLHVTSLTCDSCHTTITNAFDTSPFAVLTDTQTDFVLTFLGVEGNIKDMEKALGISYPTVKARLAEIQTALQLNAKSKAETELNILLAIEKGELTADEAVKLLKKENNKQ
jgi:hypothetical protein